MNCSEMLLAMIRKAFIEDVMLLIVLLLGSCVSIRSMKAQSFTCEVKLNSYRVINDTVATKPDFSSKANVTVDYKNDQWVIDNIDHYHKFACSYRDFILDKPSRKGTNAWYMVSPVVDGYPMDLDFDQRLMWFAYCARDYLQKNQGKPVVIPFGDTRLDCYVHGCRMNARWRSESDSCPEIAEFDFDRYLFNQGVKQLSLEPPGSFLNNREAQFNHYIQYHTNGQTIVVFKASQWESIADMEVPAAWQLDLYWYGQHAFTCFGAAENIKAVEGGITLPSISQTALITDKRVRNASLGLNSVEYTITNGQIPTVDEIKPTKSLGDSGFDQMPPNLRNTRIVIISLLLGTGFVPMVIWLLKKTPRLF